MRSLIKLPFLGLVLLLLSPIASAFSTTSQFQQWYPEWKDIFVRIIRENCSAEFHTYMTAKKEDTPVLIWTGGSVTNRLAQPVVDCILGSISEFIKANMSSAAVVLGLTPMILATMGNSVEEISTLVVVGRRPILGLCLAAGSPAVAPALFFEYLDPMALLAERLYRLRPKKFSDRWEVAIIGFEYILAFMVIANTINVSLQLGVTACNTFAPHLTYLPFLWCILVLAVHLAGILALWVRTSSSRRCSYKGCFDLIKEQLQPLRTRNADALSFEDESYLFLLLKWFTSLMTIFHIIYGTLVFSSVLFISVRDSLTVIARFMGSALLCRIILMYKLSLLRDNYADNYVRKGSQGTELHRVDTLATHALLHRDSL